MKQILFYVFFLNFFLSSCYSQGRKINLKEVEVNVKSIPIIYIEGVGYSFRERDYFIKLLLTESFWSDNFKIKIDLSSFYENNNSEFVIEGKTIVKIDDEILSKKHQYRSHKKIKKLLPRIKEVSIIQNDMTEIFIKTNLDENVLLMNFKKGNIN